MLWRIMFIVATTFSPTDLHVESLFRLALAENSVLETLVVANPSADHRKRIRGVFSQALKPSVIVRQYQGLAEFAGAIGRHGDW